MWKRTTGVRVFVLDQAHRLLLVRMVERETGDSYWVLPGGGIEDGEHAEEAAVREILEETGLEITIDRLVYLDDLVEPWVPQLVYTFYFLAHPMSDVAPTAENDSEVVEARFFSQGELKELRRVYPEMIRERFWEHLQYGFPNPYRKG